jgi:HPr kinase/phosphorylase
VLILGPSGAGKSSLALRMMALGARLVADDRTEVAPREGRLVARAPDALHGLIEARGMGLLRVPDALDWAEIALVVDLGRAEPDRLPPWRTTDLAGVTLPLVLQSGADHLASALMVRLAGARDA